MLLLVGGWATNKHRGFKVEITEPGETVTRIIGSTFFTLPKVSCQTTTLVNILFFLTRHDFFHNKTFPFFFNASMFLKTT